MDKNTEYDFIEYIKTDSLRMAKDIFFEIKDQCNNLSILPTSRRIVPELQQVGILKYRELIFKRWKIVYKIENEKVYILIVVDSRRDIEDILFGRLLKNNNKLLQSHI